MDQLREGLKTLNILETLQSKPDVLRKYFLSNENELTHVKFIDKCCFNNDSPQESVDNFKNVVKSFDKDNLLKLLKFVTGAGMMSLSRSHIAIKFAKTASIFASTCSFELIIPMELGFDTELQKASLLAVIDSS